MSFPSDLKYTREHEWVRNNGDGTVTVGVTSFAQEQLGDIIFVEVNEVGTTVDKDASFGTIEAVKTVSELYAPVSGEIIEINGALNDAPETVNNDCYGDGWIIKLKVSNASEWDNLLDAAAYQDLIA